MRIIAGRHRGTKLHSPPDKASTRPIPDQVKESLFNLLRGHSEDAHVLDVFAGTGSIGLEALSRGAQKVVFIEKDKRMARVLQQNIDRVGRRREAEVVAGDALSAHVISRAPRPLNLAFIDPPYPMTVDEPTWNRIRRQAARIVELLADDGFMALRTPWPFVRKCEKPEPTVDEFEALDAEDMAAGVADTPPPKPEDMPLEIEGAEGPETHVYRHTAVHLYMRRRHPGGEPAEPRTLEP